MTITAPMAVPQPRRLRNAIPRQIAPEISRDELIRRIRQLRTEAYLAGRRVPGRPALVQATGASPYRVRQALEEIARDYPRFPEPVRGPADQTPASRNGTPAGGLDAPVVTQTSQIPPATTSQPRQPASQLPSRHSGNDTKAPGCSTDERAPTGASTSPTPPQRIPRRDLPGSVARGAVLVSMFVLAAAVWIKAAALSGHQIELAVLPVVNWPVRLAYFAPILVEGAVYAAIRICHTLDYVRDATRNYARRTAAIGLVAMVLVGATVGLGLADEPYVRDVIGGLLGGLGPYMGWRTSRASAMVAGDRRAATDHSPCTVNTAPAPPNRLAVLLDMLTTAATTRVASWSRTAGSGARAGGPSSSPDNHEPGTG